MLERLQVHVLLLHCLQLLRCLQIELFQCLIFALLRFLKFGMQLLLRGLLYLDLHLYQELQLRS